MISTSFTVLQYVSFHQGEPMPWKEMSGYRLVMERQQVQCTTCDYRLLYLPGTYGANTIRFLQKTIQYCMAVMGPGSGMCSITDFRQSGIYTRIDPINNYVNKLRTLNDTYGDILEWIRGDRNEGYRRMYN